MLPYERAVAYYALPRVTSHVTLGLIIAYCVCLAEVVATIAYGLLFEKEAWTRGGLMALAALIVFGVVMFLCRAFLYEVRERRLLDAARDTPDPRTYSLGTPDPFQGHVLLRRPRRLIDNIIEISKNAGELVYTAQRDKAGRSWEVSSAAGGEPLTLRQMGRSISFSFEAGAPSWVIAHRGGEKVADAKRRFSVMEQSVVITDYEPGGPPEGEQLVARANGLYRNEILIGRTYQVRRYAYLDIREESLTDGLLGFFIAMV